MQFKHPNNWIRGFRCDVLAVKNAKARSLGLSLCDGMAAWTSGQTDSPDVDLIERGLRSGAIATQSAAATALTLVLEGRPDAEEQLHAVLSRVPAITRGLILRMARRTNCLPRHIISSAVIASVSDRSWRVRAIAVEEVAALRLAGATKTLRAKRASEPDRRVRFSIDRALSELASSRRRGT